jgi:aspartate aminotransferase-like enzyme
MMAVKKKVAVVDAERFAQRFAEVFGRLPTAVEFVEWCTAWGGEVEKDKCVFTYVEV